MIISLFVQEASVESVYQQVYNLRACFVLECDEHGSWAVVFRSFNGPLSLRLEPVISRNKNALALLNICLEYIAQFHKSVFPHLVHFSLEQVDGGLEGVKVLVDARVHVLFKNGGHESEPLSAADHAYYPFISVKFGYPHEVAPVRKIDC